MLSLLALTAVHSFSPTIQSRASVATRASTKEDESAFVPLDKEEVDDETFQKVEMLGRGAAKVCGYKC